MIELITPKSIANGGVIFFSLVAAILWFASTRVRVNAKKYAQRVEADSGWSPAQIIASDGSDVVETVTLQGRWSMWASIAAGMAALSQTAYAML